ncbi:hypothetical protein [Erythrobacter rubeus]|uniref:Uncharacterized protein n=1 Tax=Erythrobacter rubeus TaxID=2760803 RepID=A0ABR8KQ45_9SPHN|nr:hypothetical protein [Erythrobacter rubeus]MBD2842009.1 hypothetical protein [Erythrobacter rubeus]
MTAFIRSALAMAGAAALAASATAQDSYYAVYDVAFFERVAVGEVEITPFGIIEESRCTDRELCRKNDRLIIAAVLHSGTAVREIPLVLGRATRVPGGFLRLTRSGAEPVRYGAIPLGRYSLDIEYISDY